MQLHHFNPRTCDTTAGGTDILTSAEANGLTSNGLQWVMIVSDVDIVLVSNRGLQTAIPGTVANSPFILKAGSQMNFQHQSGAIRAISTAGTANIKIGGMSTP